MAPERLACLDVAEMHLDERKLYRQQRVPQRHAGVSKATGIEDQKVAAFIALVTLSHTLALAPALPLLRVLFLTLLGVLYSAPLNTIDEFVLGVALEGPQFVPRPTGQLCQSLLNGG